MNKVLLIELSDSHSEVFSPVRKFLQEAGYDVDLFVTETYPVSDSDVIKRVSGKNRIAQLLSLNSFIHSGDYRNLYFNTAEGLSVRDFCFLNYFNKLQICGTLHQAKKLNGSFTQKVISSKIKNYFVLAEYIKEYVEKSGLKNKVEYFYPLCPAQKITGGEILTITIPGEIALWRRDYIWLAEFIKDNIDILENKIRFIFLGSSDNPEGRKVKNFITENRLQHIIIFYDNYVPAGEFENIIRSTDLIFPLLNPGAGEYESYRSTKISGAFNLSMNYRIPLLLNADYKDVIDFKNTSLYYDKNNFRDVLITLSRDVINSLAANFENDVRFSYEYQSNKFRKFVNKIFI